MIGQSMFWSMVAVFLSAPLALFSQTYRPAYQNYGQATLDQFALLTTETAAWNFDDPISDLERNFARGDKRFIGVFHYVLSCPGVQAIGKRFIQAYGVRPVYGTSEVIESQKHAVLMKAVTRYAQVYNRRLLVKLRQQ